MITFEHTEVTGWESAIRGMRNPFNSWGKSDTTYKPLHIGTADHKLMITLTDGGPVHAKFRRMILVTVDITAPLYWWKEMDTYKVGTVADSCSTMHTIANKEFTLDDFSHEHLSEEGVCNGDTCDFSSPMDILNETIYTLNSWRQEYLRTKDKNSWWQLIQLLPTSYNQRRTLLLNYEVLSNIYSSRNHHKLDEWRSFCTWIEGLPYSEIIT